MIETGIYDINTGVKMKHAEQKMKPIGVGKSDVEVEMQRSRRLTG